MRFFMWAFKRGDWHGKAFRLGRSLRHGRVELVLTRDGVTETLTFASERAAREHWKSLR
jgi:hypothetical protein